jgi:hypothetical protein
MTARIMRTPLVFLNKIQNLYILMYICRNSVGNIAKQNEYLDRYDNFDLRCLCPGVKNQYHCEVSNLCKTWLHFLIGWLI